MTPARRRAKALGFDPWARALQIVQETSDPDLQFPRLMEIMPYLVPRLRSIEVAGDIAVDSVVRIVLGDAA